MGKIILRLDRMMVERKISLNELAERVGISNVNMSKIKNHYCFSVFIRNQAGNHLYLSISDVRFWKNEWFNRILIRTAAHEKDYYGGGNNYTSLPDLTRTATWLFRRF